MREFPIIDAADQQFGAYLNNQRVTIRVRYNPMSDRWSFDLSLDDIPVLHGRRIVLGVDLLAPFTFDIGRLYALATAAGGEPNRAALPGGLVRLYHLTDAEYEIGLAA